MTVVPAPDDLRAALDPVADALEALGVAYRVGGSVASSALGVGRSTLDIDLVADLRDEHVEPLVARLAADYYVDADPIRDAIQRRPSFNVIHLASMMKVDLFVLKTRDFDRQAFARATERQVGDAPVRRFPMTAAEDIILQELEWYRLGNEIAQDDVIGVLRLQGTALDRDHLERPDIAMNVTGRTARLHTGSDANTTRATASRAPDCANRERAFVSRTSRAGRRGTCACASCRGADLVVWGTGGARKEARRGARTDGVPPGPRAILQRPH